MSRPRFFDPRQGDPAVQMEPLDLSGEPFEPARTNCFTLVVVEKGQGSFRADVGRYSYVDRSVLCLVPYQHVRIEPESVTSGSVIRFHANFLCVETFHAETGCAGVLFNNPYRSPAVRLDRTGFSTLQRLVRSLKQELTEQGLASDEAALAYLKLVLILAARRKTSESVTPDRTGRVQHPLIEPLSRLIEEQYCQQHSPAYYAGQLHVTAKTLGRIVREQLGKTLTDLVRERILTHAKWQLLHTLRPVKEIAREVGFQDELYFSRFFKKGTGVSPTFFREFETEIRGGSNLSMDSFPAPIQKNSAPSDDS